MMALSLAVVGLFSTSGAHPEVFGYHPVESITGPVNEDGEAEWSTADMIIGKGWRPTVYDEGLLRALFGGPRDLAPDTRGWAFAYADAPGHGVMLIPIGRGVVAAALWDHGLSHIENWRRGSRLVARSGSAWLNALADFQREVLHDPPERP